MCEIPTDSCCKTYSSGEPEWVEFVPLRSICHARVGLDTLTAPYIKKRECYGRVAGASTLAAAAFGAAACVYSIL